MNALALVASQCSFCAEDLPRGARQCPACLHDVDGDKDVYELSAVAPQLTAGWQSRAIYTLDDAVKCPHCREPIRTLRILNMTRTEVAFTSTLPRKGRVIVCPECDCILSAEL
jgi:hypothetical protein